MSLVPLQLAHFSLLKRYFNFKMFMYILYLRLNAVYLFLSYLCCIFCSMWFPCRHCVCFLIVIILNWCTCLLDTVCFVSNIAYIVSFCIYCWLADRKGILPVKNPATAVPKYFNLCETFGGLVLCWSSCRKVSWLNSGQL